MKKVVTKFEKRLSAQVRKQKKLNIAKEWDFKRGELLEKYVVNILYRQNNKFKKEYLRNLGKNQ